VLFASVFCCSNISLIIELYDIYFQTNLLEQYIGQVNFSSSSSFYFVFFLSFSKWQMNIQRSNIFILAIFFYLCTGWTLISHFFLSLGHFQVLHLYKNTHLSSIPTSEFVRSAMVFVLFLQIRQRSIYFIFVRHQNELCRKLKKVFVCRTIPSSQSIWRQTSHRLIRLSIWTWCYK